MKICRCCGYRCDSRHTTCPRCRAALGTYSDSNRYAPAKRSEQPNRKYLILGIWFGIVVLVAMFILTLTLNSGREPQDEYALSATCTLPQQYPYTDTIRPDTGNRENGEPAATESPTAQETWNPGSEPPVEPPEETIGILGSAGKIYDTTVVVSIFANDRETYWDFQADTDVRMMYTMKDYLGAAVNWIDQQCNQYGADPEFIYDWQTHTDLFYTLDFPDTTMVRADGGGYLEQRSAIQLYIDSERLKEKYNAQNILYILYFNTDLSNAISSWALSDKQSCDIEVINAFVRWVNVDAFPASSCAHEILHLFGAYDLYYASEAIPQEYVNHCATSGSKDIMFTVNYGMEFNVVFSDLDAYYVGLRDTCADVQKWNLAPSTHLLP